MTQPTLLLLFATACTAVHLPQVYVRASLSPSITLGDGTSAGDVVAFDAGLLGPLGDADVSAPDEAPTETPSPPPLGRTAPCRISVACAWERRAVAEARARVIGGPP
jgi:hypothetical protein